MIDEWKACLEQDEEEDLEMIAQNLTYLDRCGGWNKTKSLVFDETLEMIDKWQVITAGSVMVDYWDASDAMASNDFEKALGIINRISNERVKEATP